MTIEKIGLTPGALPETRYNLEDFRLDDEALRRRVKELSGEFHSPVDFGNGIVAKGPRVQRRFARRLRLLKIPQDLTGKTVLDIGAWDGYFTFEFERRGAKRVLAVDRYAWENRGLECFLLARERFKSKVEYRMMDVHDLDPAEIGTFDLVFCAGVLYHLRHPLLGLERIRSVTAGTLILETASLVPAVHESTPLMTFFPGDAEAPSFKWHHGGFPTEAWLAHALQAVGFARHEIVYRPSFKILKKLAALATNRVQTGRLIAHAHVR
jgi:tRNA (mo5U34)-methyltransferase